MVSLTLEGKNIDYIKYISSFPGIAVPFSESRLPPWYNISMADNQSDHDAGARIPWRARPLADQIRWLRYLIPVVLVLIVISYQLGVAQWVELRYGYNLHYWVEIAFYSLTGPVATALILTWIERELREKEALRQEREAVLEEERARIARDLHDSVAQTLYFLALKTDHLRQQSDQNEALRQELRVMGRSLREVIREIRRTIFALRPLDWSGTGFLIALERFVEGFAEQAGLEVSFQVDEGYTIPPRLEPTIFRLVQESLNNVAKHAQAKRVWIRLSASSRDTLRMEVRDDGVGFDTHQPPGHGIGLQQMRDRAQAAGGEFVLRSQPGKGTTIQATFPRR